MPRISVVVPTYRRPELLARCLRGLFAQTLDSEAFEIVVVDDGHDDASRDMVEKLRPLPALFGGRRGPRLRYLRPPDGRGPAVARNAGWRASEAELIAFTDDDTVPQAGWLEQGERAMRAEPAWSALCGRVQVPLGDDARREPTDHELMTLGLETAEFVTANAFVRRSALLRIGGFDERFKRAWREDSDLQFRLLEDGGGVGRCDDAVVLHPVRRERWGVCLRQQRNAFFDALLYKKHPRLYRERIHPAPPWNYYAIVLLLAAALAGLAARMPLLAATAGGAAAVLILLLASRRLKRTSHAPAHVAEMLATSALIPFLSVYWRLLGALKFRVMFL